MKLNPDDPRLSAYLLGELNHDERAEVEQALAASLPLRDELNDLRQVVRSLEGGFAAGGQLSLDPARFARVLGAARLADRAARAVPQAPGRPAHRGLRGWWLGAGVAAAVAISVGVFWPEPVDGPARFAIRAGGGGGDDNWQRHARLAALTPVAAPGARVGKPKLGLAELEGGTSKPLVAVERNQETESLLERIKHEAEEGSLPSPGEFPELTDQQFRAVEDAFDVPLPLLSGGSSWSWVRRFIDERHTLPPANAVRIEEMINAFPVTGGDPSARLAMDVEVAQAPWNPEAALAMVRVANQTPDAITASLSARFHASGVSAYRLIGYADFGSASAAEASATLAPGTSHLLLIELRTHGAAAPAIELNLQSNSPLQVAANTPPNPFPSASQEFRFATLIACFGKALRAGPGTPEVAMLRQVLEPFVPVTADQSAAVALIHRALPLLGD